jgi:hypothetical protein
MRGSQGVGMNERIQELAREADKLWDGASPEDPEWCEKFAELIVRECMDIVSEIPMIDNGHPHPAWKIKEHFGVEQ